MKILTVICMILIGDKWRSIFVINTPFLIHGRKIVNGTLLKSCCFLTMMCVYPLSCLRETYSIPSVSFGFYILFRSALSIQLMSSFSLSSSKSVVYATETKIKLSLEHELIRDVTREK